MSSYTKNINIEPDGAGYIVTIIETVDGTEIITEKTFPDADELKAYTSKEIDDAEAAQAIHELRGLMKAAEVSAWFRELDEVGQNDYRTVRRPQLSEWMQSWHWEYTEPGEQPVICEISGGGQLSPVDGGRNLIRITPDNKRRWEAGTGQTFTMVSADQQIWEGYDSSGEKHLIEKIAKI